MADLLHCGLRSGSGPASHCFYAGNIVSDASGSSLHLGLPTEGASVLCVLADFSFLHHSPGGGTAGPVFPDLGVFSHITKTRPKPGELSLLVISQFYDQQDNHFEYVFGLTSLPFLNSFK